MFKNDDLTITIEYDEKEDVRYSLAILAEILERLKYSGKIDADDIKNVSNDLNKDWFKKTGRDKWKFLK